MVAFVEQLVDTAPLVQPGVKVFLRILACVVLADSSVNVLRLDTWDVVPREDSAQLLDLVNRLRPLDKVETLSLGPPREISSSRHAIEWIPALSRFPPHQAILDQIGVDIPGLVLIIGQLHDALTLVILLFLEHASVQSLPISCIDEWVVV